MSNRAWNTLPIRVGISIGAVALVFILFSLGFFFHRTYHEELQATDRTLSQLAATVQDSAAISAYLGNEELALEVTHGLAGNDIVAGAAVAGEAGIIEASGDLEPEVGLLIRRFPLLSPFNPPQQVGEITVKPNRSTIEQRARQVALDHVLILGAYSLFILGLAVFLVHVFLTRPIRSMAYQLHEIEPGSDQRLKCPKWHQDSEIGELISDSNRLLESVSATLERERALHAEIETLGRRFRLIFERASGGIALLGQNGQLHIFNPSFEQIFGAQRLQRHIESSDSDFAGLFNDSHKVADTLCKIPHSRIPIGLDLQLHTEEDDFPRWIHCLFSSVTDETGKRWIEIIVYDISERTRREHQTRLEAERDPLTELFNRRSGKRRVQHALDRAQSAVLRCALLMIDLDRFKPINDTHGHEVGDRVLREVARRLQHSVREGDLVIRWGGDEFLLVITQGRSVLDPEPVARKILYQIDADMDLGNGHSGCVGASIGIAMFPDHGDNLDHLIELADSAMYRVKEQGRNGFCVYSENPVVSCGLSRW